MERDWIPNVVKTHGDARTRTLSPDVSMFSPSTREGEAARSGKTTEMNIMPKIELNNLYQWFGLKTVCILITQLADMSFISCWDTLWYIRIISYYTRYPGGPVGSAYEKPRHQPSIVFWCVLTVSGPLSQRCICKQMCCWDCDPSALWCGIPLCWKLRGRTERISWDLAQWRCGEGRKLTMQPSYVFKLS